MNHHSTVTTARRRTAGASLAIASLSLGLLAGAPTAARADDTPPPPDSTIRVAFTNPATVAVGIKKTKTVDLTVRTVESVTQVDAALALRRTIEVQLEEFDRYEEGISWEADLRIAPSALTNAHAGEHPVHVIATGLQATDETDALLRIVRASRLTANATPEPVRKGHRITIRGKLQRANWDKGVYQGNRTGTVQLQFRTKGGTYATVKSVRPSASGAVKTSVRAKKDGFYRLVYAGSPTTQAAKTKGDFVDVR